MRPFTGISDGRSATVADDTRQDLTGYVGALARMLDLPRGGDTVTRVRTPSDRRTRSAPTGRTPRNRRRTLAVLAILAAVLLLLSGNPALAEQDDTGEPAETSSTPAPATRNGVAEDLGEDVYREYVTPAHLDIPGAFTTTDVTLFDDLTGLEVPLAGKGVTVANYTARVHLPQLPPGTFTLAYPGGERRLTVLAFDGTLGPVTADPTRPWALYALASALLVLAVTARRRKVLLLPTLGAAALLLGLASFDTDGDGDLLTEWTACEGANAGAKDQLSCKIAALTGRLERGEYDAVRSAVSRTNDPACHEITHRSSYHIWRTTRDETKAARMLIPGCDDGLIHGISESMATFATDEEFPALLDAFCSVTDEAFVRGACFHGGGHAAVWRTNGNLTASFALCERFPVEGLEYDIVSECKGSAIMEWSERWTRERAQGGAILQPRIDEPMQLCVYGPANELFRLGCYLGTNFRTGDARAAAEWCTENETFLASCFAALGENLPYFETPMTTIPLTLERGLNHLRACALAPDEVTREACVRSAVRVYSVMRLSHREGGLLCEKVEPTDLAACREGVADAEERLATRGLTLK